ncbi:MAG: hypothetical protein AAF561_03725 [Planctomycetota bacterium]
MSGVRKSHQATRRVYKDQHRAEHWYRDEQIYFITSKVRDGRAAFFTEEAKEIFWDRFDHYCARFDFTPFVTSLVDNHYHTLGFLRVGENLGPFIKHLHGSVAKLVNDTLPERIVPFWRGRGDWQSYFDGCIRDETQCRRAFRYTLNQSVRHGLARRVEDYPHTRVKVDIDRAVKRALELNAFLEGVPYKRYARKNRS